METIRTEFIMTTDRREAQSIANDARSVGAEVHIETHTDVCTVECTFYEGEQYGLSGRIRNYASRDNLGSTRENFPAKQRRVKTAV